MLGKASLLGCIFQISNDYNASNNYYGWWDKKDCNLACIEWKINQLTLKSLPNYENFIPPLPIIKGEFGDLSPDNLRYPRYILTKNFSQKNPKPSRNRAEIWQNYIDQRRIVKIFLIKIALDTRGKSVKMYFLMAPKNNILRRQNFSYYSYSKECTKQSL